LFWAERIESEEEARLDLGQCRLGAKWYFHFGHRGNLMKFWSVQKIIRAWLLIVGGALAVVFLPANAGAFEGGCNHEAPLETQVSDCGEIIKDPSTDPNDLLVAHFIRGLAHRDLGDPDAAIEDFNQAVAIRPEDPQLREFRGNLLLQLGDFGGAIADLERVIEQYPNAYGSLASLCYARSELGNHWHAIEDCEKALRFEPNSAVAYNNMALALFRVGAHQIALNDIKVALSGGAKNWAFLDTRAHILIALDKPEEAIAGFLEVIELGGATATKFYQDALQAEGYYDGPSDGLFTEALRSAISDCVEDGCGPLAEAGVLPGFAAPEGDNIKSQVLNPTYLCLAKFGLGEDAVFLSNGARKTLVQPDGSVITVVLDSSGKQRVLARDPHGLFAPELADNARAALLNCE